MKYVYVGWGPDIDPEGEIVRPLDEREFDEQPTWGRWAAVGDQPPEQEHPGYGEPMTGIEHPADGTMSPPVTNPPPAVPPVTPFAAPATPKDM